MLAALTLLATLVLIPNSSGTVQKSEQGLRPLFNGNDLTGWADVNCAPPGKSRVATFTVKDGKIICTGVPTGVLRSDRMYENFIVECEWRHMKPGGNAGFFVWADPITSVGVPFTRGVEVQVLDGPNGDWYTTHGDVFPIHGATMKPENPGKADGRAYPTEHRSKPSPEWNHYRIECVNGSITLAVNGKVVTKGHNASPRKGYLCLESEGGTVEWRNLKIKELPPSKTPLPPDMVAMQDGGWKSVYNGIDLEGWRASDEAKSWEANDWTLKYKGNVASTLRFGKAYVNIDLIVDFKQDKPGDVTVGQSYGGTVRLTANSPGIKPVGEWNRVELSTIGGQVKLKLNGTESPLHFVSRAGHGGIDLAPTAPTQFANIYVREAR
jgi:hypothetical protein